MFFLCKLCLFPSPMLFFSHFPTAQQRQHQLHPTSSAAASSAVGTDSSKPGITSAFESLGNVFVPVCCKQTVIVLLVFWIHTAALHRRRLRHVGKSERVSPETVSVFTHSFRLPLWCKTHNVVCEEAIRPSGKPAILTWKQFII